MVLDNLDTRASGLRRQRAGCEDGACQLLAQCQGWRSGDLLFSGRDLRRWSGQVVADLVVQQTKAPISAPVLVTQAHDLWPEQ